MVGTRDVWAARLATVEARADGRRAPVPVADSVVLAGVGLEMLCEVVGAVSQLDARGDFYTSGWSSADSAIPRTYTTSPPNQRVGVPATLTTRRTGFSRAFGRLVQEARAVRADGVVDVSVDTTYRSTGQATLYEVVIKGVAVRAIHGPRASAPFTTSLSGVEVAAAMREGLVPVTYLQSAVMGVRHVDPDSARQLTRRAANGEVEALTDLLTVCRERARADFSRAARQSGADYAVVDDVTCDLHNETHGGMHTATARVTGTALASFTSPTERASTVSVVPLSMLLGHGGNRDVRA